MKAKPEWIDGPLFCNLIRGDKLLAQVVKANDGKWYLTKGKRRSGRYATAAEAKKAY